MAESEIDDELWQDFHRVVNMTSRELQDWLMTLDAGEDTEEVPDQAGTIRGQHVLAILGKRRTDINADDERVMRRVVEIVTAERGVDLEPTAGEDHWRRRLMSLGHDPLKPVD